MKEKWVNIERFFIECGSNIIKERKGVDIVEWYIEILYYLVKKYKV